MAQDWSEVMTHLFVSEKSPLSTAGLENFSDSFAGFLEIKTGFRKGEVAEKFLWRGSGVLPEVGAFANPSSKSLPLVA